ncbi:MAG: fimbrial biogenesis chaperone [Kluyvera sp.]|uniref:fimbrial biogenesis chaperone n=1 Tax=Kluyvera sp. TaxID=1538228 RepID=UPI003F36595E
MRALTVMLCLALVLSGIASAGMVATPTRMVYDEQSSAQTVAVKNSGTSAFLASATFEGKGTNHFTITPPLVRVDAGDKTLLRVRATNIARLPTERESVFYYAITMIASGEKPGEQDSRVAVAARYWFKLFYRPSGIGHPESGRCDLTFTRTADGLHAVNQTPFYITLSSFVVDGQRVSLTPDTSMIAPRTSSLMSRTRKASHVEWAWVNDFGGTEDKCRFSFTDK